LRTIKQDFYNFSFLKSDNGNWWVFREKKTLEKITWFFSYPFTSFEKEKKEILGKMVFGIFWECLKKIFFREAQMFYFGKIFLNLEICLKFFWTLVQNFTEEIKKKNQSLRILSEKNSCSGNNFCRLEIISFFLNTFLGSISSLFHEGITNIKLRTWTKIHSNKMLYFGKNSK